MSENLVVGFIGNPNCGKTTLFNAFTGANLKVANWPGVTVEKVEGALKYHNNTYRLVDLPGTYSLTSYTMEEQVSRMSKSREPSLISSVVIRRAATGLIPTERLRFTVCLLQEMWQADVRRNM